MVTICKRIFVPCIVVLLFSSCFYWFRHSVDLGDNYICHFEGGSDISVYSKLSGLNTRIYPTVTEYNFDENFIIVKQNPDYEYYKLMKVDDYWGRFAAYSTYLRDSTSKRYSDSLIRESVKKYKSEYDFFKKRTANSRNTTINIYEMRAVADSVFHTDPYYVKLFSSHENYWIIDKKNNIRYGPLSIQEFHDECEKQKISLKFD